MVYVLTGVAGCGKSTVGRLLAQELSLPFYDADDFHPPANIERMRQGVPLTDVERLPWLKDLARRIQLWNGSGGGVLACSALKRSYRRILSGQACETIRFIYLDVGPALARKRLQERTEHFFTATLLDSQFRDLEVPGRAIKVDAGLSPTEICSLVMQRIAVSPPDAPLK